MRIVTPVDQSLVLMNAVGSEADRIFTDLVIPYQFWQCRDDFVSSIILQRIEFH